MKTVIEIPDDLIRRTESLARRRKMDVSALAQEALRQMVEASPTFERTTDEQGDPFTFVTDDGHGLHPDLPEDFIEKIRDWAYENRP